MINKVEQLIYKPNSNPFHIPISTWTQLWWKWLHSAPRHMNPATDKTGLFWNSSQLNPNVWFLAGTLGGSAIRRCSMSDARAILFPIITSAFSYAVDPQLKTEKELAKAAKEDIDRVVKLGLILNGTAVENLERFRIRTKPFRDVINGIPTIAVSDGYWIFLKPLKVKKFKIYFVGQNVDFFNEVTYYLSIY